jgi:phage terminase small subunit
MSRERDAYEDRVEARLADMEHRFDGLEARMKGLDKAAQERLQVDIDELRDRKDALEQKVDDLHKVSDQSWMDVKASLDRDLDQLESAYDVVSSNNR